MCYRDFSICTETVQQSEYLRGEDRVWGGAGITFPWFFHGKGSYGPAWLWHQRVGIRSQGFTRHLKLSSSTIFFFFFSLVPESLIRNLMTWCECLVLGLKCIECVKSWHPSFFRKVLVTLMSCPCDILYCFTLKDKILETRMPILLFLHLLRSALIMVRIQLAILYIFVLPNISQFFFFS